ncbi:GTP-binding protein [bacterium]|nr:GTP-binding protein [bacterium]
MAETPKLPRNPIVVVLGHVDHGKTSLLDAIRNTSMQKSEAGGITQNIYISNVVWKGDTITFVDTPGHEVFSLMRVNGGKVADIAFLIVAADEGVQPQTLESIDIIQSNHMKYIVVITKCDKEEANPEKVKTELMTRGVYLEGFGGDVPFVEVSAVTKKGLDTLLDLVYLYADVEKLLDDDHEKVKLFEAFGEASTEVKVHGVVLDSSVDKALGKQAFCVLRMGTIKKGDTLLFGPVKERVGLLFDANKKPISEVTPGMAFIATGLSELPMTGVDIVDINSSEVVSIVEKKFTLTQTVEKKSSQELLDDLFNEGTETVIPVILKTDVNASLFSILPTFEKFNKDNIKVKVISSGVGAISMSDVETAKTFKALLIGFRVKVPNDVTDYAKQQGVTLSTFDIVYHLYDLIEKFVKKTAGGDEVQETIIGTGRVKKVFVLSDGETVIGNVITDGEAKRNSIVRVTREGEVVGNFQVQSLKILKEEKKVVKKGSECGVNIGKISVEIKEEDLLTYIAK